MGVFLACGCSGETVVGTAPGPVRPPVQPAAPVVHETRPPAASCDAFPGETTDRTFAVKLFSAGEEPSGDPSCTAIVNPERGFFVSRDLRQMGAAPLPRDEHTLVYGKGLLDDYLGRDLDGAVLAEIEAGFATARRLGWKVLPRFYYAPSTGAPVPAQHQQLRHIRQLGPILRANADVIAVLHAGFLGDWGEWHASGVFYPSEERKSILDHLLEVLPASRMVLVRRPSYKRDAFGGPLGRDEAYSGTPLARIGHLNDCFLAGEDDAGTYADDDERQYAVADSQFTAVGGETCAVNPPRTECGSALAELERHHWSFLNIDYDTRVIDGWRAGGCAATIACRLGYRFVLRGLKASASTERGGELHVTLDVSNDGYARAFNHRPVLLVLDGPVKIAVPTGFDARGWAPGEDEPTCLAARLPSNIPAGRYRLGLWLPDPAAHLRDDPHYAVRVADGVSWDPVAGVNLLDAHIDVQ